jgi:hypothetical protein
MDERAASAVARLILGDEAAPGEGAVNNLCATDPTADQT